MKLRRYRVLNFRSVENSGWIDAEAVTALIGVNESGKTNLLLPLWKLKPAQDGDLQPTADYPKAKFNDIRRNPGSFAFVEAEFETGEVCGDIARTAGIPEQDAQLVIITRYYDGRYEVSFPQHCRPTNWSTAEVLKLVTATSAEIEGLTAQRQEGDLKTKAIAMLTVIVESLPSEALDGPAIEKVLAQLGDIMPEEPAKTSSIVPRLNQLIETCDLRRAAVTQTDPGKDQAVVSAVVAELPSFVYYSNYGNLDSEIYLPHVVQNLQRADLGAREIAKARTLRVLFKFVGLEPDEILELGRDFRERNNQREPNQAEIDEITDKKRTRSILLQSAGTKLTSKFKEWWKQGDYRFRFEADGNHFRIWVSDGRRPEEVELEGRSTGLQWFLSFYLVFLVESEEEHRNAVLLLDEPGLSLHPLAQRDLSAFFDGLSRSNAILYTTHSPFLVDADRLDRVRKVYVDEQGKTRSTADLRLGDGDARQAGAAYAVHSALNLNVAESLLLGCRPVIVEGASDQHYLTAIKALLIGSGAITPTRELVFPPSGGTKTARIVASILSGRDEELPFMLLDGDEQGKRMAKELQTSLYAQSKDRLITMDEVLGREGVEIEDLIPVGFFAQVVDRWERTPEQPFADVVKADRPVLAQLESWAASNGVTLPQGWKVEVAQRAKKLMLDKGIGVFSQGEVENWKKLFDRFEA